MLIKWRGSLVSAKQQIQLRLDYGPRTTKMRYDDSLRVRAGIWKVMRKGTGESLSPLNEHRQDYTVMRALG